MKTHSILGPVEKIFIKYNILWMFFIVQYGKQFDKQSLYLNTQLYYVHSHIEVKLGHRIHMQPL